MFVGCVEISKNANMANVNPSIPKVFMDGAVKIRKLKFEGTNLVQVHAEHRWGLSTREIDILHDVDEDGWSGNMIAFGEWIDFDEDDLAWIKNWLHENRKI